MNKSLIKNISAMAIFGTISVFVKNIGLPSGETALWRAVIAVAFLSVYKLIRREKLPLGIGGANTFRLVISGVFVGFNWILLFEAYNYTSVSVATLSYYFAPVLIMILSPIVFKEKMTLKQVLFFVMATAGLVLIIGARSGGGDREIVGIAMGIGAAVLYAVVVMLNKKVEGVSGIDKTLTQFFAAAVVLAVYVPLTSGYHIAEIDTRGLVCLLILGAVHTGVAYCLYFGSLTSLPGQKVAILSYIDPMVAVLVSVLFLRETVTVMQLVGGGVIIAASVLNELTDRPKRIDA